MKSHELQVTANKQPIRPGRGISAGRGKTAGRGTKGQNSRTGGKRRPGFEGGQNPIMQRLPKKRGFRSFKTAAQTVYTGKIDALGAKITNQELFDAGLIDDLFGSVKVVVKGDLTKKHTVELTAASAGAITLIEKAGGQFTQSATDMRPKQSKDSK